MEKKGLKLRMALTGGVLLAVYLFVVVIVASLVVGLVGGNDLLALLLAAVITTGFVALQYVGSRQIILQLIDAQELSADEHPEIHERVEVLCDRMDLPKPTLLVGDVGMMNAFALGRPGNGFVVLTPQLIQALTMDEMEGILAHELAHLDSYDVVVMAAAQSAIVMVALLVRYTIALFVSVFAFSVEFALSFVGLGKGDRSQKWARLQFVLVGVSVFLVTNVLALFQRMLSRHREYFADSKAVEHTGDVDAMTSALDTVATQDTPSDDQVSEHVQALCVYGEHDGILERLYATHPSTEKRIESLRREYGSDV
ncbi:M48 family metalloprotease [Halorubellus sp. PRR65]|uniref:M48 family metalloprotease n=1 Tax=Halorubellus sp. PRR65 TaxID=3098148 RepID=UPI002B25CD04|nr:M48 family metalloprotease [Halorubellus sp. PRR65]